MVWWLGGWVTCRLGGSFCWSLACLLAGWLAGWLAGLLACLLVGSVAFVAIRYLLVLCEYCSAMFADGQTPFAGKAQESS